MITKKEEKSLSQIHHSEQTRKAARTFITSCLFFTSLCSFTAIEESAAEFFHLPYEVIQESHNINFNDVPMVEFVRYVSKISKVNFIYNPQDLQFNVSLTTGKDVKSLEVLQALLQMFNVHGLSVLSQENYFVVKKVDEASKQGGNLPFDRLVAASKSTPASRSKNEQFEFFVYKLKYHQGSEIQEAIKKISADLKNRPDADQMLVTVLESAQWVKATNSLLFPSDGNTTEDLKKLLDSLDIPLRQVFIEVLVIETDVKKSLDFGLQWAAGGDYMSRVGFGAGNFPSGGQAPFANTFQGINGLNGPTGAGQIPLGNGFDLGVIGDLIMHKGKSYLSLGALVSALQVDGESSIVLNQKIITQDNKNSTIFVGDNIPFTGSVVQTVGSSQQTTANIEYRDIGVSLSITPMLGDDGIITLDLDEEISETVNNLSPRNVNNAVNGIRTTKTNMVTHVHVPDKHFLVLSGMIRNAKRNVKAGVPCLGGIPGVGALFSNTRKEDERRNVIIFVRPHIIRTVEDFKNITQSQKELYQAQSQPNDFNEGLNLMSTSVGHID
jgi:type III secretion protein C